MEIQNITITPNMSSSVVSVVGGDRLEIFSNNFWGKEEAGYDALTSRLRQAKQACEDVRNMFHERALIEEEYAKRLMKIAKLPIGKDETGTLRDALEVCRQELEATAKEHITLSQKIRTELEQEVDHFIARQKEKRKLQQAIVEKSLRNKREQAALVQKAKEKYETECVKITGLLAGKSSIMGKDLEKLNLKIEKTQMAAKAADQEYMQLVKNAQETTQKWNYDWRVACDKFQDLEEERIDSLKTYLWTYANHISTVCVADDESCERIRVALEHCNIERDIQLFIRERATGPDIPEPPIYVNFYAGPKENGVRYKRASFDRVPAYVDGGTTTLLDPGRRLSLHESHLAQSTHNIESNGKSNNVYHTRNDSMNIERAQLYANTTLYTTNNNDNIEEEEVTKQIEEEEPVDPRAKQMLSIGDNVFEVETNNTSAEKHDEIAQALANFQLTDETNDTNDNDNGNEDHSTSNTGMNTVSNNSNGGGFRKPLPINFATDKPQPPIPDQMNIQQQQQQMHNIPYQYQLHQLQFNPYQLNQNNSPTSTIPSSTINDSNNVTPTTPSQHQQQGSIINGPGDLRKQSSDHTTANNNGPISSQQQQISQNMSIRSRSPQPNRNNQQQQQGPGDIRRMSNNSNTHSSSPTNVGFTQQVPQQVGYQQQQQQQQMQGQMIPQDHILNLGQVPQRQITPQRITSSPSSNNILNRSDTQRTTSTNNSNNSLGIQLDVHGRVKQDDLAEAYVTNGGRLPPESAKFQMLTQGIPQGISQGQQQQQMSPQGQISPQGQQMYQYNNNFNRTGQLQSSYRGPQQLQQAVQQQQQQQPVQVHRGGTLNQNSTLTSAFHHQPQQGVNISSPQQPLDRNATIPLHGGQLQQQPLVGGQLTYQSPNFYNPPIMAQFQRPLVANVGGGAGAQGFQQIQQVPQLQGVQTYGSLQPAQMIGQPVQLQYQQPLLQRSVIANHPQNSGGRPRTEDGKPVEFYVKTLYDYKKTIPEEISFTAGDIIAVLNTHSDGWWEGEIVDESRRNRGLFPSNYTKVLE